MVRKGMLPDGKVGSQMRPCIGAENCGWVNGPLAFRKHQRYDGLASHSGHAGHAGDAGNIQVSPNSETACPVPRDSLKARTGSKSQRSRQASAFSGRARGQRAQ